MAEATKIEWADSSFNPWVGCTKVSTAAGGGGGCDHCYAEVSTPARVLRAKGAETWGPGAPRHRTSEANWRQPIAWNAQPFVECMACGWRGEARACTRIDLPPGHHPAVAYALACARCADLTVKAARRRIFCASLADVFDNEVDPGWRVDLFQVIADTPELDWLLLTKRIGNAAAMIDQASRLVYKGSGEPTWPWPNVWLGATVVNQAEADRDVPKLLATPAAVRFLSIEPMLGAIDLAHLRYASGAALPEPLRVNDDRCSLNVLTGRSTWPSQHYVSPMIKARTHVINGEVATTSGEHRRVDWVIAGGESGPGARPAHPGWFRSLRDQCASAGVPFLLKQHGEWIERDTGAAAPLVAREGDPEFNHAARQHDAFISLDGHVVVDIDFAEVGVPYRGIVRVGKKAAGRLLDGVEHNGFPKAPPHA